MATDREKASWLKMTLDIRANELFDRDFNELIEMHQITVLKEMIIERDFKGL